jgi:archaellum biogenesis protein FlaJ (TadC family)
MSEVPPGSGQSSFGEFFLGLGIFMAIIFILASGFTFLVSFLMHKWHKWAKKCEKKVRRDRLKMFAVIIALLLNLALVIFVISICIRDGFPQQPSVWFLFLLMLTTPIINGFVILGCYATKGTICE